MTLLSAWLRIPHSAFMRLALALFATAAGRALRPRLRGSARPAGRRVAFASAALVIVGLLAAGLVAGSPGVNADADCQVPPTALASTFDAEASGVVLSWLAPASCVADEYAVYRRDMSADGGKMLKIATVEGDSLSYADTSAEAGKTYRYRIRSNDQGPRSGLTLIDVPALEPDPTPPSNDLNDRVVRADPTFNLGLPITISVAENTASATDIGSPYTATDTDMGDTLSYHLSGPDAASFSIVSTTGQVQTSAALNFEVKTSYSVTVGVRDTTGTTDDDVIGVAINITDVNEAPTIAIIGHLEDIGENTGVATIIQTYMASDEDVPTTFTWTLEGVDAGHFTIGRNSSGHGELKFAAVPDFESPADEPDAGQAVGDNNYEITVKVSDGSLSDMHTVRVIIINVEEAGVVTLIGTPSGGSALTASLTDPDGKISLRRWTWASAASATGTFTDISGASNASYTTVAADVDQYLRATVRYTDRQGPNKSANAVTAQIAASNSEPTFGFGTLTKAVNENSASGTNVGSATTATDTDNDTLTYSLSGTDSGSFTVDSNGQIKTKSGVTYDFESKSTYSVTLNVHDNKDAAGGSDTTIDASVPVTINLENVDEPAAVTIIGTESGGSELTATLLVDPDGAVSSLTWRWARGNSATGTFTNITGMLGSSHVYTTVAADVGKYLRATASYTDPQNPGKSANAVTGQIGASNAEPTFSSMSATRTLPENSGAGVNVVGGTITASDSDSGDTLTYSLTGTDAGSFEINASGQIKTKTGVNHNFNFEATKNSYSVTVQVHDGKDAAGGTDTTVDDTIAVTINLTNVNEPPMFTVSPTSVLIPEQSINIRAYQATDPDAGDTLSTLSWSVDSSSPDFDSVTITTTGELRFKTVRDFENPEDANADNFYEVTVQVADAVGAKISVDVVVEIGNVNDAPVIISGPMEAATVTADENTPTTEIIATHQSYDQDDLNGGPMDILTWSLSGDDAGDFIITRDTTTGAGILKFRNQPDFENPADKSDAGLINGDNNYDIIVQLTDGKNSSDASNATIDDTRTLTVTVEDVNEAPVISGDDSPNFAEIEFDELDANLDAMEYEVDTYTAVDEENDNITWAKSGTDAGHFTINSTSGVLSFSIRPNFENPVNMDSNNVYEVVVEAMDDNSTSGSGGTKTGTYAVTVNVTNVDETPVITSTGTAHEAPSFAEIEWDAATVDLDVQTYTARDEGDGIVSITWSLGGDDAGDFNITTNTTNGEGASHSATIPTSRIPRVRRRWPAIPRTTPTKSLSKPETPHRRPGITPSPSRSPTSTRRRRSPASRPSSSRFKRLLMTRRPLPAS